MTHEEIRDHFNKHDPFSNSLGIRLEEVGEEYGVATMPLTPRHRNGMGNAHGGAIFALIDMTFAAACCAMGTYCVNTQSSVSYLRPGRIGPLRGEVRKVRAGRNLGVYNVQVTDADQTLVAVATITGFFSGKEIPSETPAS